MTLRLEDIKVGDRLKVVNLDGPHGCTLRGSRKIGDVGTVTSVDTNDDNYPIKVEFSGSNGYADRYRLCYFEKEKTVFKQGDRVIYNQVRGDAFTAERNGKVGTVTNAGRGGGHVNVKWDDGSSTATFPYVVNLTKVEDVAEFKIGDRVRYTNGSGTGSNDRIGQEGVIVERGTNPNAIARIKWDDGRAIACRDVSVNNVVPAQPKVDPKELAKAYFAGNTDEVERLLAPFKVESLVAGTVVKAPDLNLVWVVTKAGVKVIDTAAGSVVTSDMDIDTFSEYVNENGFLERLA